MHPARFPYMKPPRGTPINKNHQLTKGLVGCWIMNEGGGGKVYDLSGNGNHGTMQNMTATDWVPGKFGPALDFDGSNDYVDVGKSSYDLGVTSQGTYLVRVKADTIGAYNHVLYDYYNGNGMTIRFQSSDQVETYVYPNNHRINVDNVVTTGEWYFVGITFNSNGNLILYLDGDEIGTDSMNGDSLGNGIDFRVGWHSDPSYYFNGLIDDVRIYNRALSAGEIDWLYREPFAIFEQRRARWAAITGGDLIKVIGEIIDLSEARQRNRTMSRLLSEEVNLQENISRRKSMTRIVAETLNIDEVTAKILGFVRVISETLNINETKVRLTGLLRWINETTNINEAISRSREMVRLVAEALNVNEGILRTRSLIRLISETLNVNEVIVRLTGLLRWINEAVNITETNTRIRELSRVLSETLNINEAKVRLTGLLRIIADAININEGIIRLRSLTRIITEALNISEVLVKFRAMIRIIAEAINLNEIIIRITGLIKIIAEMVRSNETIAKIITGLITTIMEKASDIKSLISKSTDMKTLITKTSNIKSTTTEDSDI